MAVRLLWIFPGTYLPRRIDAWRGRDPGYPPWRHVLFVGLAGMRGADSLVIALALPLMMAGGQPFPGRGVIIFVTFVVIVATLVPQGLLLGPLIHWLGMDVDGPADEEKEEHLARLRTAKAGVAALDRIIAHGGPLARVARDLRARHIHRVHRLEHAQGGPSHGDDQAYHDAANHVRGRMLAAERRELVKLRDRGTVQTGKTKLTACDDHGGVQ